MGPALGLKKEKRDIQERRIGSAVGLPQKLVQPKPQQLEKQKMVRHWFSLWLEVSVGEKKKKERNPRKKRNEPKKQNNWGGGGN